MKFSKCKKFGFLGLSIFLLSPLYLTADESNFKVDSVHSFPVVEKKANYSKYEGTFAQKPNGISHQMFPGQKIFINFAFENGGFLVRDGKPLGIKYPIQFNHLLFSPDHKVVLAYGVPRFVSDSKKFCFIDDQGNVINTGDLILNMAKVSDRGFVGVCQEVSQDEKPGAKNGSHHPHVSGLYLCGWDFSGQEVWRTALPLGEFAEILPSKLSISPNGDLIILGLTGSTRVFNGNGKELERFKETYSSFIADDNETTVLVSRQHIRVLNLKNKTILFHKDLDENSKSMFRMTENPGAFFGPDENQRADKVVITEGVHHLDKIIVFDSKNKKITHLDPGPADRGAFSVYYSASEGKIIFVDRNHIGKNIYESIDSKN